MPTPSRTPKVIRAAIDRAHVQPDAPLAGAPRNRLLPADDGRMSRRERGRARLAMSVPCTIRLQREPFDAAAEAARADARPHRHRRAGHLHRHLPRQRRRRADRRAHARALSRHGGSRDRAPCRGGAARAGRCSASPSSIATAASRRARTSCWWSTASSHREAAFAAAEFLMDYLKTRAPFWKQVENGGRQDLGRGQGRPTTRRPSAGGPGARSSGGMSAQAAHAGGRP